MKIAAITDIGKRQENEDSFLISTFQLGTDPVSPINVSEFDCSNPSHVLIMVVGDGMGGLEKGKLASTTVIKSIQQEIATSKGPNLIQAIMESSRALHSAYGKQAGTTVSALVISANQYISVHAGDSRIYHKSAATKEITLLSEDHTGRKAYSDQGITDESILRSVENKLTNAIGVIEEPELDILYGGFSKGDQFLIASDGFWHQFSDSMNTFKWYSTSGLSWALEKSRELGETDNATAIGVKL